jgi:hypothetical protein
MTGYTKDFEQSLALKLFTGAVTAPEKPVSKRSRKLARKAMRPQLEFERKLQDELLRRVPALRGKLIVERA